MSNDLTILTMAKSLAAHATTRQGLVTQNIANADTPGFAARDVRAFADVYNGPGAEAAGPNALRGAAFSPAATRAGHAGFEQAGAAATAYDITKIDAASPNGNTVSLEDQLIRGARAQVDHDMALGVLRKSMDLIRMAIGRAR